MFWVTFKLFQRHQCSAIKDSDFKEFSLQMQWVWRVLLKGQWIIRNLEMWSLDSTFNLFVFDQSTRVMYSICVVHSHLAAQSVSWILICKVCQVNVAGPIIQACTIVEIFHTMFVCVQWFWKNSSLEVVFSATQWFTKLYFGFLSVNFV